MKASRPRLPRGFTMMELLVVISIIVVLAGLTLGGMNFASQKQAREKAKVQISLLQMAIEDYKADQGEYPSGMRQNGDQSTDDLIRALFPNNPNDKVYLAGLDPARDPQGWRRDDRMIDPWGNEFRYRVRHAANPGFDLWSTGPDGESSVESREYDPKHEENVDDIRGW